MTPALEALAPIKVDVELQQEELLHSKYGGMLPKSPLLGRRRSGGHKRFDSAEWALAKQGKLPCDGVSCEALEEVGYALPMKWTRTVPPPRRLSNLGCGS